MKTNTTPASNVRGFDFVVKFASALSLGIMAGFIAAVRQVNPELRYAFDWIVVLAGVVTAALVWWFCAWALNAEAKADAGGQITRKHWRWLGWFALITLSGTALGFVLAVIPLSPERRSDIIQGTGMAIVFLTILGFIYWRVMRFFERDSVEKK